MPIKRGANVPSWWLDSRISNSPPAFFQILKTEIILLATFVRLLFQQMFIYLNMNFIYNGSVVYKINKNATFLAVASMKLKCN